MAALSAEESPWIRAATQGDLETLQALFAQGHQWDTAALDLSNQHEHLHVLQWAKDSKFPTSSWPTSKLVQHGLFNVLKWQKTQGDFKPDGLLCRAAALIGHLPMLQWLREQECAWDKDTTAYAARKGHLETLIWARKNGCKWTATVCREAAKNNHVDVLKWAHENGCPWTWHVVSWALGNGHLEALQYAFENHAPIHFMPPCDAQAEWDESGGEDETPEDSDSDSDSDSVSSKDGTTQVMLGALWGWAIGERAHPWWWGVLHVDDAKFEAVQKYAQTVILPWAMKNRRLTVVRR